MSAISARIQDPSQIAEARRNARQLAADLKFGDHAAEKVAIVVTEACTNLIKHASGGQIIIDQATESSVGEAGEPAVIEILALDKGPGIENLSQSREDGYSTSGTSGTGLGAVSRLSDYWGIYTRPGRGTVLLARISASNGHKHDVARNAAIRVPKPGQDVCGDDWGMTIRSGHRILLLADGLGHGPDAARASAAAVQTLYRHADAAPGAMIEAVHEALRHTRGAAVAVAEIDAERGLVRFSGLGNISASILADGESVRHLVSINGTAGMEARHIREFTYPWPEGGILVLHSDGIGSHWSLGDYPALGECDPTLIAGVIYRDLSRGNDDATIVVAK